MYFLGGEMSVDVMILPGRRREFTPAALFESLALEAHGGTAAMLGTVPALVELSRGGETALTRDEALRPGRTYRLRLPVDNTLTLSLGLTPDFDEREYVEDYGKNLSAAQREAIIEAWRRAGPGLTLTSGGGRAPGELELLAVLVRACALILSGWISIESGAFVRPAAGIYAPHQLKDVRYQLAANS
jgi:hypothetical protein